MIKKSLGSFVGVIFFVLLSVVLWQVISRYALVNPSTITEELSRFLLMWLGLFGASYTLAEKGHLAIDILPEKLTGKEEEGKTPKL